MTNIAPNPDRSKALKSAYLALVEARPVVQGVFALRFLVGGLGVAAVSTIRIGPGLAGQAAWFAAIWLVYLVNGISDIEGDRINQSVRPLANRRLSVSSAEIVSILLGVIALAVASTVSWVFTFGTALIIAIGWFYSMGPYPLKASSWASSLTVGFAGFLTYVCGSIAFRQEVPSEVVFFAAIMALWMAAAGNSKDFGSERGDALARRKSLPLALGHERAAIVVSCLCIGVGVLGMIAAASSRLLGG